MCVDENLKVVEFYVGGPKNESRQILYGSTKIWESTNFMCGDENLTVNESFWVDEKQRVDEKIPGEKWKKKQ